MSINGIEFRSKLENMATLLRDNTASRTSALNFLQVKDLR
jgi:hypothetical protein